MTAQEPLARDARAGLADDDLLAMSDDCNLCP